jgi:hypothetical protein
MKYTFHHSEISENSPKRLVFADFDQPQLTDAQKVVEAQNLRKGIEGQDADPTRGIAAVDGKVKKIMKDLDAIRNKVNGLGSIVKEKFQTFIISTIGASSNQEMDDSDRGLARTNMDLDTPDSVQNAVSYWAEGIKDNVNVRLREFDLGMDKVMLRVQFRKQMAAKLEAIPNTSISTAEKNKIGTALEDQLGRIEGDVDGNEQMTVDQLKARLSITNEFIKYAQITGECNSKNAKTLQNHTLLPDLTIAYPPTSLNGFTYFEYWTEKVGNDDVLHCIDNNGAIQQLNVSQTENFGKNAWKVVYNPFKPAGQRRSPTFTKYTDAQINANKPNPDTLTAAQRQKMLENGMQQWVYNDPDAKNFKGMNPQTKEKLTTAIMAGVLGVELLRIASGADASGTVSSVMPFTAASTSFLNNGGNSEAVKEFYQNDPNYTRGLRFNTMTGSTAAPIGRLRTTPSAPPSRPGAAPTGPSGRPRTAEAPRGARESVTGTAEQVSYPSDGVLPWGNETFAIGEKRTMARLKKPRDLRHRIVKHLFINDVPVRPVARMHIAPDDQEFSLNGRLAGENEVTIVYEDELTSGSKSTKRLSIRLNGSAPALTEANKNRPEFAAIDPDSIRMGAIDTEGTRGVKMAQLFPKHPKIKRTLVSCSDGTNNYDVELLLDGSIVMKAEKDGKPQKIDPPKRLTFIFTVKDEREGRTGVPIALERTHHIQEAPALDESFTTAEVSNNGLLLGAVNGKKLNNTQTVATLSNDTRSDIKRRVVDSSGTEIRYMKIEGNKVVIRDDISVTIPSGTINFKIQAKEESGSSWINSGEYSINNADPTVEIMKQDNREIVLKRGELEEDTENQILSLPFDDSFASIDDIDTVETYTMVGGKSAPFSVALDSTDFRIEGNKVFYEGTETLPVNVHVALGMEVKDALGNVHDVTLKVKIEGAEKLENNSISLKNGTEVSGISRIQTRTGRIEASTDNFEIENVEFNNPTRASLTLTEVRKDTQTGAAQFDALGTGTPPFLVTTDGKVNVKRGNVLAPGTYYIRVTSNNHGQNNPDHWVSIEVQDHPVASAEDVKPMVENIQSGPLNARVRPHSVKAIGMLYEKRPEVKERKLLSARTGSIVHQGIEFNESSNLLVVKDSLLPVGSITLEFEITVSGQAPKKVTRVITIEESQRNTSSQARPNAMPLEGTTNIEKNNIAVHGRLMEVYNGTKLDEVKEKLKNFENGTDTNVGTINLIVLDAKAGKYLINNDNYSTELHTEGEHIVLTAGPPGATSEMKFSHDNDGIKDALMYGAAMNMISKIVYNDMSHNQLDKFDSEARAGEFLNTDDGLSTVDLRSDSSSTDPDIWKHTFPSATTKTGFLRVMNKKLSDYIGTSTTGATKRAPNSNRSQLGFDRTGFPSEITEGGSVDLNLTNLSNDYSYSYTGDRSNWYQVNSAPADGKLSVNLNWDDMDSNHTSRDNMKFVRILIVATPKDPNSTLRPKIIQQGIKINPLYQLNRNNANQISALNSNEGKRLIFDLSSGIHNTLSTNSPISSGHSLSFGEQKTSKGEVVINDGSTRFALVSFDQRTGVPKISFVRAADSTLFKYEIGSDITNGGENGYIKFMRNRTS